MPDASPAPAPTSPRRFRYSLRTLFVVVTVVAVYLGWAMNWIHQRREFARRGHSVLSAKSSKLDKRATAPGLLWLFGEAGVHTVYIRYGNVDQDVITARRLFPEAKFIYTTLHGEQNLR